MVGDLAKAKDKGEKGGRLGGARADFVGSLGRKVEGCREVLTQLGDDPAAAGPRDELRRRLHALGAAARLLRFDAMTRSLQEAAVVLERAGMVGKVRREDLSALQQVLDDLPALAWGEVPTRESQEAAAAQPGPMPYAVVVVGDPALADALTESDERSGRSFEVERTDDAQAAIGLARAFAPDVVVVDVDVEAGPELVEALLDDPLTEPVPIVVTGRLPNPPDAARFIALGAVKVLPGPVAASALRRAVEEVLDTRESHRVRVTLGEPTLEQLAERLAQEVKRALLETVDRPARSCRVPLGEGAEVLGAMWGAIARVQEVVTAKSEGTIRFSGGAPEGAIAVAPWLHQDSGASDRWMPRGRPGASEVRLDHRRVVVADDDPGVTWFIADLLRTAGCEVHEALDGRSALELAFRVSPELVVSDILMPELDGFGLCRALKRDVALRDVPVILLSWKEDLLQRVRELGASAAAYLRKESESRAILARVREVLRPRARIEARVKGEGEVRGRLDGLTVRLLLELVCALRKDARIAVRDASFLYEVDVVGGAPRRATRTTPDGEFQRGERVLAALLGVGAGRFTVSPLDGDPGPAELTGSLAEQLLGPISRARGALEATTGAATVNVERVVLDREAVEDYLRATPEPARALVRRLAKGITPRQMLLAGEVPPALLEDVLADLAARGAVIGVRAPSGADLLEGAIASARDVLLGKAPVRRSALPPPQQTSLTGPPTAVRSVDVMREVRAPSIPPSSDAIAAELSALTRAREALRSTPPPPPVAYESFTLTEPPPPPYSDAGDTDPPSSLEDAVIRQISERSPAVAPRPLSSDPPPIIEPSQLRPRSSNPPPSDMMIGEPFLPSPGAPPVALLPSATPEPVVPGTPEPPAAASDTQTDAIVAPVEDEEDEEIVVPAPTPAPAPVAAATPAEPAALPEPTERMPAPVEAPGPRVALGAPELQRAMSELREHTDVDSRYEQKRELSMPVFKPAEPRAEPTPEPKAEPMPEPKAAVAAPASAAEAPPAAETEPDDSPKERKEPRRERDDRTPLSSVAVREREREKLPKKGINWGFIGGLAVVGILVGAALKLSSTTPATAPASPNNPPSQPQSPAVPLPEPKAEGPGVHVEDLPPGSGDLPRGFGMLVVTAPLEMPVRVSGPNGETRGRGPKATIPLAPGFYEVRVGGAGHEKNKLVEVRSGKMTRVESSELP